jgi:hypothetical protein
MILLFLLIISTFPSDIFFWHLAMFWILGWYHQVVGSWRIWWRWCCFIEEEKDEFWLIWTWRVSVRGTIYVLILNPESCMQGTKLRACPSFDWPMVMKSVGPCSRMFYNKNKATQLSTIKDLRPSKHYLLWDIMIFRRRSWRTHLHHLDKQI